MRGPNGGVQFYEENKAHLRFTKIIDSHLWFMKIIRKYIGISWFHIIWSFIYDHVQGRIQDFLIGGGGPNNIEGYRGRGTNK